MNRRSIFLVMLGCIIFCSSAFAAQSTASRQTAFNNLTDYFATVGKSERDKKEIVRDRREQRRLQRVRDENRRRKTETRKRMRAQQEAIIRKINAQ